MTETFRQLLIGQYHAALCTFEECIEKCPDDKWDQRLCNLEFRYVAFHTLFFTDLYLCGDEGTFKAQSFHVENAKFFADHQELERGSEATNPDRSGVQKYLEFCKDLVVEIVSAETEASLKEVSKFEWLDITRGENHVYNIRHIQHHAAQMSLFLRQSSGAEVAWHRTGLDQ